MEILNLKCPHCGEFISKAGFKTFESAILIYTWHTEKIARGKEMTRALLGKKYNENIIFVQSDDDEDEEIIFENNHKIEAKCAACGGKLDYNQLIKFIKCQ